MKSLFWFLLGIVGGFVAAHLLNKDPRGHQVLAEVDGRISAFTDRITEAYHEQEARFAGLVDDARNAAAAAVDTAKDAAASAVDAAKDTAAAAGEKLDDAADAAKAAVSDKLD